MGHSGYRAGVSGEGFADVWINEKNHEAELVQLRRRIPAQDMCDGVDKKKTWYFGGFMVNCPGVGDLCLRTMNLAHETGEIHNQCRRVPDQPKQLGPRSLRMLH